MHHHVEQLMNVLIDHRYYRLSFWVLSAARTLSPWENGWFWDDLDTCVEEGNHGNMLLSDRHLFASWEFQVHFIFKSHHLEINVLTLH